MKKHGNRKCGVIQSIIDGNHPQYGITKSQPQTANILFKELPNIQPCPGMSIHWTGLVLMWSLSNSPESHDKANSVE